MKKITRPQKNATPAKSGKLPSSRGRTARKPPVSPSEPPSEPQTSKTPPSLSPLGGVLEACSGLSIGGALGLPSEHALDDVTRQAQEAGTGTREGGPGLPTAPIGAKIGPEGPPGACYYCGHVAGYTGDLRRPVCERHLGLRVSREGGVSYPGGRVTRDLHRLECGSR